LARAPAAAPLRAAARRPAAKCKRYSLTGPKALLTQRDLPFRPIHDLEVLLSLIIPVRPDFELIRDLLLLLNDYAVDFRYPGEIATKEEAWAAMKESKTSNG